MDMLQKGRFDGVLVDADQSEQLTKIMDMFVILLEGGTEHDFKVLEPNDGMMVLQKFSSSFKHQNKYGNVPKFY